jgi:hypothetical protein
MLLPGVPRQGGKVKTIAEYLDTELVTQAFGR